jgi:hypothetical protein
MTMICCYGLVVFFMEIIKHTILINLDSKFKTFSNK